jgi:hypothetical protein
MSDLYDTDNDRIDAADWADEYNPLASARLWRRVWASMGAGEAESEARKEAARKEGEATNGER